MNANDPTPEHHAADVALVRAVQDQGVNAIQEFEQRMSCVPRILGARNARMGHPVPPEELADLVQDTLILIWRKLPEFEGRSSLETWMYRICILELMNAVRRWRRGQKKRVSDSETVIAQTRSRDREPATRLHYEDLYRGLATLPAEEERVLRLKHYDDLTFEGIGRREGISTSRAKARYYSGMQRLRHLLRRDLSDGVPRG